MTRGNEKWGRLAAKAIKAHDTGGGGQALGVHYATVTRVDDPEGTGRIRVRFDDMPEDQESHWVPPFGGFQGDAHGSTFGFPMVDDRVQIEYLYGNLMNPVWVGTQYTAGEKGELASAASRRPPGGPLGPHNATRGERYNVLRSLSGWVMGLLEGDNVREAWEGEIQSPTGLDYLRWLVSTNPKNGRKRGKWQAQIDAHLELRDSLGFVSLVWDSEELLLTGELKKGCVARLSVPGTTAQILIDTTLPKAVISITADTINVAAEKVAVTATETADVTAPVVTVTSPMVTLGEPASALPLAKITPTGIAPCLNVRGS